MTQPVGTFSFVLHSHIPYVLAHGRSPHGTDWLSEAAAETYLPLLNACRRLIAEGLSPQITLGLTPVLVEQLRDPSFQDEFSDYLRGKISASRTGQTAFRRDGNYHMAYLARFWEDWYGFALRDFEEVYSRDIVGAFRALQDAGHIEVITSSATHGYSALLSQDTSLQAQVKVGIDAYKHHFGRAPRGYWLPECSYRPRYHWAAPVSVPEVPRTPTLRKGVDEFLAENGIRYFFVEGSLLHGGEALGVYADKFGPLKEIYKQFQKETVKVEYRPYTTYHPYLVDSSGKGGKTLAVFGRDTATGQQVWSGEHGYPGDEWYLEFHKKFVAEGDPSLGLRFWRVSWDKANLGTKSLYDPHHAEERAETHAVHFAGLVKDTLKAQNDPDAILTAVYDTELFGHWWFEGVDWLKGVLRGLAASPIVDLTTASGIVEDYPPEKVMDVPEGSWGANGTHFTWMNVDTEWMWPIIHGAESRMEELVARFPDAEGETREVLNQAARELLLLESSDWPFLVTTGQAKEYAIERFTDHTERFDRLVGVAVGSGTISAEDRTYLDELEERDNPFPVIDYRVFAARQGSARLADLPAVTPV